MTLRMPILLIVTKMVNRLKEAIAEHDNPNIAASMRAIEFREDTFGQSNYIFEDVSPFGLRPAFEQADVPMQVWVSWLDAATTDGALSRYLTFSNRQQVIIGAWNHGGGPDVDPFKPFASEMDIYEAALAEVDAMEPQMAQVLEFFDCYLKDETCQEPSSSITYYTLNSAEWHTTSIWPPAGSSNQRFYLSQDNSLSTEAPVEETASDTYTVDFSTSTGNKQPLVCTVGYTHRF